MHLPGPLRAAVGLAATAATEAKHLPDRAIELPMLVVSSALQASLRAQQRYARLAARGDDVLNRRTPTDEPPSWATFDDPVPLDELRRSTGGPLGDRSTFERLFGVEDPTLAPDGREPVDEIPPADEPPLTAEPARAAVPAVVRADARSVEHQQSVTKKPSAKKVKKPAAKKPAAKKSTSTKAARKTSSTEPVGATGDPAVARAKTVSKPRHAPPSAFDNVSDD